MKISVIGGSGFIGSYLCRRLAESGQDFEIIDLKPSPIYPDRTKLADIRDKAALSKAVAGEAIIHLAAVHRDDVRDRSLYYTTNVDGTRNVLDVASAKNIRKIVYTSSVAIYGFAPPDTGEDGDIAPFNDYGKSKYESELIANAWHAEAPDERSLTIIRPTVVFGVGNRGNVYNLLRQIHSGLFMMVGRGTNRKSMAYVENVAAFLEHALARGEGLQIVNYIDKPDYDMNTLVRQVRGTLKGKADVGLRLPYGLAVNAGRMLDLVSGITGKRFPISALRIRKFCSETSFSTAIGEIFDYTPPFTLEEAFEKTLTDEFIKEETPMGVFYTE